MRPLRVLIADDDDRFREALATFLARLTGIEVAGVAADGEEAVRLHAQLAPDVALIDVVMPRCDGIEATQRILVADPSARVIALTSSRDRRALALCVAAGAIGCLTKDRDLARLAPLMIALAAAARSLTPPAGRDEPAASGPRRAAARVRPGQTAPPRPRPPTGR
jgi:DNA-binding NarL/FixJ family response regulator